MMRSYGASSCTSLSTLAMRLSMPGIGGGGVGRGGDKGRGKKENVKKCRRGEREKREGERR